LLNLLSYPDLSNGNIAATGYDHHLVNSADSIENGNFIAFAQPQDIRQVMQFSAGNLNLIV
jgi:hypothetical protein